MDIKSDSEAANHFLGQVLMREVAACCKTWQDNWQTI